MPRPSRPGVQPPSGFRFRTGYYGYDRRNTDARFRFGNYQFNYIQQNSAFSPWYYYPSLPAYVGMAQIRLGSVDLRLTFTKRQRYTQAQSQIDNELRDAIADLKEGIERADTRALERIIPSGYSVNILPPVGTPYEMDSDDFYNLMVDMASNTHTRSYDIQDVELGRYGVRLYCRQISTDPWGKTLTTYHRVTMELAATGYRIVEFESDALPY